MVLKLRFQGSNAGNVGLIPICRTKIPHAVQYSPTGGKKKEIESLCQLHCGFFFFFTIKYF